MIPAIRLATLDDLEEHAVDRPREDLEELAVPDPVVEDGELAHTGESGIVEVEARGQILVIVLGHLQLELGRQGGGGGENVAAGERDVLRSGPRGLLHEATGGRALRLRDVDRDPQGAVRIGHGPTDDQPVRVGQVGPLGRLEAFTGVDRRFQVRGEAGGGTVGDDYGHHPPGITATPRSPSTLSPPAVTG